MKHNNSIRLALIGAGAMGKIHARRLLAGGASRVEPVAPCDTDPTAGDSFPDLPFYRSWKELLDAGVADAVLIATPHYAHPEIGIAALESGHHVLVEKPMAVHKADAERLLEAQRDTDRVLTVMLSMRTKPVFRKIKELIDEGELGAIRRINWTMTDWFRTHAYFRESDWRGTWKGEGGGILLNQCPHQLDLWCWLFGLPDKVTAECVNGRYHDIETEDEVTAVLGYNDDKRGGGQGLNSRPKGAQHPFAIIRSFRHPGETGAGFRIKG